MKKIYTFAFAMIVSTTALSETPEPKVEFADVYQTHATVAGRLASKPVTPVGVTIENGGVKYSTLTDADGNWGVVFKYRSPRYYVSSFDLSESSKKSSVIPGYLP